MHPAIFDWTSNITNYRFVAFAEMQNVNVFHFCTLYFLLPCISVSVYPCDLQCLHHVAAGALWWKIIWISSILFSILLNSRHWEWIQNEWPLITLKHPSADASQNESAALLAGAWCSLYQGTQHSNILLIDFRESVSRHADEVTNRPKQLILRACPPCSFGSVCCASLLVCIAMRVEEWKISIT